MKTIVIVSIIAVYIQCESSSSGIRLAISRKHSPVDYGELSYYEWNNEDDQANKKDDAESSHSSDSSGSSIVKGKSDDYLDDYRWPSQGRSEPRDHQSDRNGPAYFYRLPSNDSVPDPYDPDKTGIPEPSATRIPYEEPLRIAELVTTISGDEGEIQVGGMPVVPYDPEFGSNETIRILAENDGIHINDRYTYFKTWSGNSMARLNISVSHISKFNLHVYSDGSLNYTDDSNSVNIFYSVRGNFIIS